MIEQKLSTETFIIQFNDNSTQVEKVTPKGLKGNRPLCSASGTAAQVYEVCGPYSLNGDAALTIVIKSLEHYL